MLATSGGYLAGAWVGLFGPVRGFIAVVAGSMVCGLLSEVHW